MTSTDTLEREPLYMTDAEIIRRMGVPEKLARQTHAIVKSAIRGGNDSNSALPKEPAKFFGLRENGGVG